MLHSLDAAPAARRKAIDRWIDLGTLMPPDASQRSPEPRRRSRKPHPPLPLFAPCPREIHFGPTKNSGRGFGYVPYLAYPQGVKGEGENWLGYTLVLGK